MSELIYVPLLSILKISETQTSMHTKGLSSGERGAVLWLYPDIQNADMCLPKLLLWLGCEFNLNCLDVQLKNGGALYAVLGWPKLAAVILYGGAWDFQSFCISVGHGALWKPVDLSPLSVKVKMNLHMPASKIFNYGMALPHCLSRRVQKQHKTEMKGA